MEKLLFPDDIAERYHCTLPTARKYMRQMERLEAPLAVTETALIEWETRRTVAPAGSSRSRRTYTRAADTDYHVPRTRPA